MEVVTQWHGQRLSSNNFRDTILGYGCRNGESTSFSIVALDAGDLVDRLELQYDLAVADDVWDVL